MKLDDARTFRHDLHPRRPGARPVDRRHHHADLSDRPPTSRTRSASTRASSTRARRTRRGRRSKRNLAAIEGGRGGVRVRLRHGRHRRHHRAASQSGDHVVVTDNTYGGTFRLFDKVLTRYGLTFSYVDTSRARLRSSARSRRRRSCCSSRRRPTRCCGSPTSRRGRRSGAPARRARWSSTTRSRARACSGRSSSAPTSSSTARRST